MAMITKQCMFFCFFAPLVGDEELRGSSCRHHQPPSSLMESLPSSIMESLGWGCILHPFPMAHGAVAHMPMVVRDGNDYQTVHVFFVFSHLSWATKSYWAPPAAITSHRHHKQCVFFFVFRTGKKRQ
jgi:hypothetical protein